VYLYSGAFGSKIISSTGQEGMDDIPALPYKLVDNIDSSFELTDVIFINLIDPSFS
jgi:hypothetical protein